MWGRRESASLMRGVAAQRVPNRCSYHGRTARQARLAVPCRQLPVDGIDDELLVGIERVKSIEHWAGDGPAARSKG